MKWKCAFKTTSLFFAGILIVAPLASRSYATSELVNTAAVRVDGMVCYFCSAGLEKQCKLQNLGKGYKTDLPNNLFKIKIGMQEPIPDPAGFEAIVKDAGFTYRSVQVELIGFLNSSEVAGQYQVVLPISQQVIPVSSLSEPLKKLAKQKVDTLLRVIMRSKGADWEVVALKPMTKKALLAMTKK